MSNARAVLLRAPLMLLAAGALLTGMCAGLMRLGWHAGMAPLPPGSHGPLMVCGFLGTLIGLERAVASGKRWPYLAPLLSGAGGAALVAGAETWIGALLATLGSAVLVLLFVDVLRRHRDTYLQIMALGAVSWLCGNVLWLSGLPLFEVVYWWAGFLILTIAGERLELSRVLLHRRAVQQRFVGFVAVLAAALLAGLVSAEIGVRLFGASLVLLAAWLLTYDIARRTIRMKGLTRFTAACLLSGYFWLFGGGLLLIANGAVAAGAYYDAALHALFVGFVFSMIFGHAPVIFPSVLHLPVAYRPYFYGHLVVLHASLVLRVGGDLFGLFTARRWGSLLNAGAVMLFLAGTALSVVLARRVAARTDQRQRKRALPLSLPTLFDVNLS